MNSVHSSQHEGSVVLLPFMVAEVATNVIDSAVSSQISASPVFALMWLLLFFCRTLEARDGISSSHLIVFGNRRLPFHPEKLAVNFHCPLSKLKLLCRVRSRITPENLGRFLGQGRKCRR